MGHLIQVELPEDVFQRLATKAKECGLTPEQLVVKLLTNMLEKENNSPSLITSSHKGQDEFPSAL